MRVEDIDFYNILLDEKSHGIILIYDISYKTFMSAKALCIRFDNVKKTRYLVLFGHRIYNAICDKINYLLSEKIDDKYVINYNFARIKIDSYNSLLIHYVIMLIKSVVNRNKNDH